MRLDTSIALLVEEKRGADTASCMFMRKSTTFRMDCSTPMAICVPPGAPSTISGWSSLNTMVGHEDVKRDLPGAMLPARPGRGSKTPIQPLYMKPSPRVTTPEGMASECVRDTQLPSPSTTDTCVVSLGTGWPGL